MTSSPHRFCASFRFGGDDKADAFPFLCQVFNDGAADGGRRRMRSGRRRCFRFDAGGNAGIPARRGEIIEEREALEEMNDGHLNEPGRIHGIRCVLARTDGSFGQKWHFAWFQLVCDRPTDGRIDQRTDGHILLKRCENASKNETGEVFFCLSSLYGT